MNKHTGYTPGPERYRVALQAIYAADAHTVGIGELMDIAAEALYGADAKVEALDAPDLATRVEELEKLLAGVMASDSITARVREKIRAALAKVTL